MIFEEYGKQLFELISDHTQLGIAVIGVDGRFLYYNRALEEMEGLETGEMLGKHVLDVFPSSDPQTSTILQCIETGKPIYDDLQTYINFKGRKVTSIVTNIPIIIKGEIKGVLEIIYNANRIKQIYESTSSLFEDEEDAGKSRAKHLKNSYYV
ncbi:MAG TPA: PAS domain S-box protein, partial [Clostridia bacterium]|nr:PAS domain S-box protein [Clostridia bacterium]